jgi:TrmH family RNA methyltransferase
VEGELITSLQNPKIQWVRRLQAQAKARRAEGVLVAEGIRLLEEALQAGWEAALILYAQPLTERGLALLEGWRRTGAPLEETSASVLTAASDTYTSQGLLAVLKTRSLPLPENPDFLLVPDGVRDPGNLGTILRTALAAGVQAVLLPPGTVDPWSPKVMRSGMGAHFRLPLHTLSWQAIRQVLHPPLQVLLADSSGGEIYYEADLRQPLALVIGGEAAGAGDLATSLSTAHVHIPMPGKAESLNAGVASAILLFEVVRQRGLV